MPGRERIHGPYQHRVNTWRVIVVDRLGRRAAQSFTGEGAKEQAEAFADKARARLEGLTVSSAVAEFLDDMRMRDCRPSSVASTGYRLRTFFRLERETDPGGLVAELNPARMGRLLDATVTKGEHVRSVAYRAGMLAETKTFVHWCVKRGYLRRDVSEGLEVVGRRKRGKVQLRIDEARKFSATCLDAAANGDKAALAALLCLWLGCRASEVTERVARDVDDNGRILWIPTAKTEAGRRRVELPKLLRSLVADAVRGLEPDARIFPAGRHWLHHHVGRLCEAAKVPEVCTQSLRGLHATLATDAGVTAHAISSALGHTNTIITQRHYTQESATERARQERAFKVLAGGKK